MSVQVTHNNKGHFYRIAIDIAKEGSELWDLTPYVKGRVGDNRFGLQIVWFYQGRKLDVTNMKPFIRGNVGHYSFDELKNLQMAPDADVVTSHGDPNDCGPDGEATYYFPEQMFPKDGIFKGFIGLESNDGDKQRLTGVNIWFSVLPNVANMGKACDFYVDVLDKTVANFNEKIRQQGIQFDTVLNQELQKEKDLIQQKLDAASDAIDTDKAALKKLSAAVGAIQAQINAGDVVTLVRHEKDFGELKDGQTLLSQEISKRLAQIAVRPEAFLNLDDLKAKYPKGAEGIFIVGDTKHGYIYNNGEWVDTGTAFGTGLTNSEERTLHNALYGKTIVYDAASKEPPYDDLDTLETNTIVTYATDITEIRHAPDNLVLGSSQGATVMTFNYSSDTADSAGKVQWLIDNNADQYVRVCWGNPVAWSEWKSSLIRSYPIVYDNNLQAPFDNLNTLPANSLIIYATSLAKVSGIPDDAQKAEGATVLTLGSHLSGYNAGTIQILILSNGRLYHRLIWGSDPKYIAWTHSLTMDDLLKHETGIMAYDNDINEGRYNDLNSIPVNKTVTYSITDDTAKKVKNLPEFTAGTVRTLSCDIADAAGQIQIFVDQNNNMYHRILWGYPASYGPWKSEKTDLERNSIKPTISLFQNIGIIGDSYASGELYVNEKYTDHYDISWGQILARKNGIKAVNFSKGGLTTRDWLADDHGLSLLNSSDQQDLYLIALGINDYQKLGDSYLGVENDINTETNTFYGNYGKIISAIRTKAPQSKIVLSTMSYDSQGTAHNYNEAIKTLAQHFGLPVIEQNNDPLFTSDLYLNHMVGGHPTAPIYAAMANAFQRLIEKSMVDNLDYFMTYKQ